MPNFCTNKIRLVHQDPDMIRAAETAADEGKLLEFLRPSPNGIDSYAWCVENWGTKWDLQVDWLESSFDEEVSVLEINAESAWTPPLEALKWAEAELGFEVEIYYIEVGAGFMGLMARGHEEEWDTPRSYEEAQEMLEILPLNMISQLDLKREFDFMFPDEENE